MTEEERRRLLRMLQEKAARDAGGVQLTRAGRRHMEDPSRNLRGRQVYRDPVDERIAGYSGLVRPLAGLADRITRPGRAGTAQRMNREYLENIHKRRLAQAQAQGAQADVVVKQLQAAAASDDPKISGPAIKRLTAMQKAMYAGRNTNNPDFWQAQAKGDSEGSAELVADKPDTGTSPLTSILPGSLTLSEARARAETAVANKQAQIDALDRELESLDVEGATRAGGYRTPAGGAAMGGDMAIATKSYRVPVDLDWIAKRKEEIPTQKATLQAEIRELEKLRRPLSQPAGIGGPGHAPQKNF